MDLDAVMEEVATTLGDGISGLRAFGYPVGSVTPPAAIVTYPDELTYDGTYARGMDRISLPVFVVVGKASDRTTRTRLAAYVAGSGDSSVKAVLEAGTYTSLDTIVVQKAEFDVVTIAAVDYMAALFTLDITGSGA